MAAKKHITEGTGLPNWSSPIGHAGFSRGDIAFDDLKELPQVNQMYMDLFPQGKRPARTIYQAEALPFGGKIKITCTAVKDI